MDRFACVMDELNGKLDEIIKFLGEKNDVGAPKTIENEIMTKMARLPILNQLIESLFDVDENEWLKTGRDYKDNLLRVVTIEPDVFEIKRYRCSDISAGAEKNEVIDRVSFSYTANGFRPLHAHYNNSGECDVSLGRVCYLWASIVRERMRPELSGCRIEKVIEHKDSATFQYRVPDLAPDWF